jgi:hypothetical protein
MKPSRPRPDRKSGPPPGAYRNGVDLTQIRYLLSLTPAQRLQVLQDAATSLAELRASAKI